MRTFGREGVYFSKEKVTKVTQNMREAFVYVGLDEFGYLKVSSILLVVSRRLPHAPIKITGDIGILTDRIFQI